PVTRRVAGIAPTSTFCDGEIASYRSSPQGLRPVNPIHRRCPMQVAVYVRVSTDRQAQAQTIEQQLERLRAHAQAQGWQLLDDHVFRDDGYSGASLNRPALDRLRDLVTQGAVQRVLITAPDRL